MDDIKIKPEDMHVENIGTCRIDSPQLIARTDDNTLLE